MPNGNGENENNGDGSGSTDEGKKPFEGEFDAARAARLIENLRSEVASLKEERNTLKSEKAERDDAEKTEVERLKDALAAEQEKAKGANRALFIARAQAKHGLSDEDAEEFLSGLDDEEKILARAERIAGRLKTGSQAGADDGTGEGGEETGGESGDLPSKPKPGLRPGTGADDDGGLDEDAIVKHARERRGY